MHSANLAKIEKRVARLTREEQIALAAWVARLIEGRDAEATKKRDIYWEKISGILSSGPDPFEYQRQVRSEWDRDSA
jgi:hypothetical protein